MVKWWKEFYQKNEKNTKSQHHSSPYGRRMKNKLPTSDDDFDEDEEIIDQQVNSGDQENTTTSDQPLVEVLQIYSPIACRECRKGHRKCDKALPVCANCRRKDKVCVYPQAKRNRKAKSPTKTLVPLSGSEPFVEKKTEEHVEKSHKKVPKEKHGKKHVHDE